jgi:hypothetical protein
MKPAKFVDMLSPPHYTPTNDFLYGWAKHVSWGYYALNTTWRPHEVTQLTVLDLLDMDRRSDRSSPLNPTVRPARSGYPGNPLFSSHAADGFVGNASRTI